MSLVPCTQFADWIHAVLSVAHFLENRCERSALTQRKRSVNVHADLALCERCMDAEQTQGKCAADNVDTNRTTTRHRIERRLDTLAPGLLWTPKRAIGAQSRPEFSVGLVCVHVCVPSASGRRSDRVHGEAGECLCALALCSLCVRPASTKSKLSAHSGSTWRSHCARFDFTQSADIRFHCTVIGNQFEFLRTFLIVNVYVICFVIYFKQMSSYLFIILSLGPVYI